MQDFVYVSSVSYCLPLRSKTVHLGQKLITRKRHATTSRREEKKNNAIKISVTDKLKENKIE